MATHNSATLEELDRLASKAAAAGATSIEDTPTEALTAEEWRTLALVHNKNSRSHFEAFLKAREERDQARNEAMMRDRETYELRDQIKKMANDHAETLRFAIAELKRIRPTSRVHNG